MGKQNGTNFDYYFIIKELVGEADGEIDCLVENTEKYLTFSLQTHTQKFVILKS